MAYLKPNQIIQSQSRGWVYNFVVHVRPWCLLLKGRRDEDLENHEEIKGNQGWIELRKVNFQNY